MSDTTTNIAADGIAGSSEAEENRVLIIAAAQIVLKRDGRQGLSLSAVARQAGLSRAAVYACYSSRQDLLNELKDDGAPVPEAEAEAASEPVQGYDNMMRAQAQALESISRQVIVPKPVRDSMQSALSRMDARLAVTEQSLAAFEQRLGGRLQKLESDTGQLAETLQGLRRRLQSLEEKHEAALAALRLEVHNLSRPAAKEPAGPQAEEPAAAPAEASEPAISQTAAPADAETSAPAEPVAEEPAWADDAPADEPARDMRQIGGYLNAARQAAIAAAERKAAQPARKPRSALRRFFGKRRWTLVVVTAVLVAWFDIYIFAHYQPAHGAEVSAQSLATAPRLDAVKSHAPMAWSPHAQLTRGLRYLNGTGVPVDVERARHWIERAALGGLPVAQNLMGVLYQTGTGGRQDIGEAVRWYEAAAARGNVKAMTNLGKFYAGGRKDSVDFAKAAGWFSRAAAFGDVDAQFDLAILYERGQGVPRDPLAAYKWYMIAGKSGDTHAAMRASILAAQLGPDEVEAANTAVADFVPAVADRDTNEERTVRS